ncbi:hypothetical protein BX616_000308 [Lobosporangium transversale]|nr:hypothetical protein BX616_000308 [Lobosporangium transversale]
MNRELSSKAAARAKFASAPVKKAAGTKKKSLVSTVIKPKASVTTTTATTTVSTTSLSKSKSKSKISTSTSSAAPTAIEPKTKKRKASEASAIDGDDDDERPEHDLDFLSLLSPSIASKKAKKSSPSSSSLSSSLSSTSSTSASSLLSSKRSGKSIVSKPRTSPEVVVFDASKVDRKGSSATSTGGTEFNFKKFMSSKVSKLDEAPAPMETPLTSEEKAEELENKRNDAELHNLIKASRLLEQYNADQLDGVERRRHQRDQLVSLGIQKKEKIKTPLQISFGMIAKQRERDLKELEEAKNNGMYHKSIKHTFAAAGGKKKEKPRSERGLKTSMGRYKNGMLTLTEREIKAVQREGVKKKPSGKRSGGGNGGGGKGGKKKKGMGRY